LLFIALYYPVNGSTIIEDFVNRISYGYRLTSVVLFGLCMAYFEAAVVVYLRELIYPEGFSLPLRIIPGDILRVEIAREAASLLMIMSVAALAGRRFWERFGYFLIIFGVWDIFYYVWLWVTIDWPSSLVEWDILFLIPRPWLAPVIAPMLIALLMVLFGLVITRLYARGKTFQPTVVLVTLTILGTGDILYSFMHDTNAVYNFQMPQPYLYWLLTVGLVCYLLGFLHAWLRSIRS
jgi:hypothetical protein